MSLEIAPEIESSVRQYARRAGVTIDELLARAFPAPQSLPRSDRFPVDDPRSQVAALLDQWQQKYGLPVRPDGKFHTSAEELLARWDAEDAQLAAEQAESEQLLWADNQKHHQRIAI